MNICEYIRKEAINKVFGMNSFASCWSIWQNVIESNIDKNDPATIFDLGDYLSEIFKSTSDGGRSGGAVQSKLSAGGACWEGLVCWYLNLCLIGSRTVVIKHAKDLIPSPVADAITVSYDNFKSTTESDLIAITFPDEEEFNCDINHMDMYLPNINLYKGKGNTFNYKPIIDKLTDTYFNKINICVIQCKTNWNDNAQIPMLWDMVYSGHSFSRGITVGYNGYHIQPSTFSYAFVTVPSNNTKYVPNSTPVKRVRNLSGGNYWGRKTVDDVAKSIKELLTTELYHGINGGSVRTSIVENIKDLNTKYDYFNITL